MINSANLISTSTSNHVNDLRFILICMVVAIHTNLVPDTNASAGCYYNVMRFLHPVLIICNSLFFFISGYFFFVNCDSISICKGKIKKRIKTLLIPYLIWNTMYWLFYAFLLHVSPSLLGESQEPLQQISLSNFWRVYVCFQEVSIHSTPIVGPFWFLRNLMLFVLLTPLIQVLLRSKFVFIIVVAVSVFLPFSNSLPYFLIGCMVGYNHIDWVELSHKYGLAACAVLIVAVLAFVYSGQEEYSVLYNLLFFTKSLPGIMAISYVVYQVTQYLGKHINESLVKSVFIIYALHYLIARPLTKIGAKILLRFNSNDLEFFVTYFLNIVITVILCVLVYKMMLKISPKVGEYLGAR